jgi:type I restriction enzyme R subunit
VTQFRELLRIKNILTTFADFSAVDLNLPEQDFEDYKSKYLDLHDKVVKGKQSGEKTSILEDVDFELTLIHRDDINVAYILGLLQKLNKDNPADSATQRKAIVDLLAGEIQLRSKRVLIEAFISDNLPKLNANENVMDAFSAFWTEHRQKAFEELCQEENLVPENLQNLLNSYLFNNRLPREQQIKGALDFKPKIRESKSIIERIAAKIKVFIDTFIEGMGGSV